MPMTRARSNGQDIFAAMSTENAGASTYCAIELTRLAVFQNTKYVDSQCKRCLARGLHQRQ